MIPILSTLHKIYYHGFMRESRMHAIKDSTVWVPMA